MERGVINRVVEPTSILVNRRARRAKTDRLDAQGLLRILAAHAKGDHKVCSVVRVPTIEEEDAKRQHRERELKPSAHAALVQLKPAERGEPPDHRILDTNRSSDEEITGAVAGFPPDLRDERFLDCESEEGRRRGAAPRSGRRCNG
jgi:transposase